MKQGDLQSMIRLLAVGMGIVLWLVGALFSVNGFGIGMTEYQWVGWVLALGVTVGELVVNEGAGTITLKLTGLICYVYDIGTNFGGMWLAQGQPDYQAHIPMLVVAVVVAFALAVVPEAFVTWGLTGLGHDPLGSLVGGSKSEPEGRKVTIKHDNIGPGARPPVLPEFGAHELSDADLSRILPGLWKGGLARGTYLRKK